MEKLFGVIHPTVEIYLLHKENC